ncbi:MAG: TlpA disulfide reductase family protein [Planctomycetota bacterium]|jgi:peroxiredoxin Q/BCP
MNRFLRPICAAALVVVIPICPAARADELRNAKPGDQVPDFQLPTMAGEPIGRADFEGKAVILVFLSAQQRSSESAAASAFAVYQGLHHDDLALVFVTADTAHTAYFRQLRDKTNQHEPLGLDFERTLYGRLGLIVLPTTILVDKEWKLAHVISSYRSDYEHVLKSYAQHTLGLIDDDQLRRELETESFRRDRPADRIARHRAAAQILWKSGMLADVEKARPRRAGAGPGAGDGGRRDRGRCAGRKPLSPAGQAHVRRRALPRRQARGSGAGAS